MDRENATNKKRHNRLFILIAILLVVLLIGGFLFWENREKTSGEQVLAAPITAPPSPSATLAVVVPKPTKPPILPNILPYYQQNPDTVGYIYIENTDVDYPVVYSGDNEFYLNYNFDKEAYEAGAIFLDFRCDIEDFGKTRNVIIYGHRMKDGTMFKSLTNYQNKTFFYDNPIIQFDTLYRELEWEVFAVFIAHTDFYYIDTYFPTDAKWMALLAECQSRSMYETDVTLVPSDIVLTLSTCSAIENKRLVVMAKLIR
ncbi:MAG: class B sortase [Eubacteriales bacterium]